MGATLDSTFTAFDDRFGEGDRPPVRRPDRIRAAGGQRPLPRPVRVHDVDFGEHTALRRAHGLEGDLPPVGRPDRDAEGGAAQRLSPGPVCVHDGQLAVRPAHEGDPPPVGRPDRNAVHAPRARHVSQPAPVGVHDEGLDRCRCCRVDPLREGDLLRVGRKRAVCRARRAHHPRVTLRSPLPSTLMTYKLSSACTPSFLMKAIMRPSDDQEGHATSSNRWPWVSLRSPLPSTFIT